MKKSKSKSLRKVKTKLYCVLVYYETKPKMTSSKFGKYVSGQLQSEQVFQKGKLINKFRFIYDSILRAKNLVDVKKHLAHIGKVDRISEIAQC